MFDRDMTLMIATTPSWQCDQLLSPPTKGFDYDTPFRFWWSTPEWWISYLVSWITLISTTFSMRIKTLRPAAPSIPITLVEKVAKAHYAFM